MKISIITPSHNSVFLKELEDTIMAQSYKDWEWIILLNNGAGYEAKDKRIKIIETPFKADSIGLLKKLASHYATGDILAEVDHDDLLTPDCLEEISRAFKDTSIGFVYSDNARLGRFTPFNSCYGWKQRSFKYKGEDLPVMYGQPLTPGRLGYIWYAPDHIRAWRRSVYEAVGGHDGMLTVCDDLDLMHRTYLVTKFHYIPKVLYIYRLHGGDNTYLQKNKLIQDKTVEIYNQNIYQLAERFADIHNLMKIDLCGGFNKPKGYTAIDKQNGDIICDLENGIPLSDNSVGVVRAHDALEHIRNQQLIMSEIHRVLVPGGILLSQTPSTDGRGAWQDPTHVSFWNQNSFWYWTRKDQARFIRNEKMFRECALYTSFPSRWHEENKICYVTAHLEKI